MHRPGHVWSAANRSEHLEVPRHGMDDRGGHRVVAGPIRKIGGNWREWAVARHARLRRAAYVLSNK